MNYEPCRRPRTAAQQVTVMPISANAITLVPPNPLRKALIMTGPAAEDIYTVSPSPNVTKNGGPIILSQDTTLTKQWTMILADDDIGDAICQEWFVVAQVGNVAWSIIEVVYLPGEVKPAF
jgi:hypothetical protein